MSDTQIMLIWVDIALKILFIPWYVLMIATLSPQIRTDNGKFDHVTFGMILLLIWGIFSTLWVVWIIPVLPIEPLIAKLIINSTRIIVTTYFMYHLRLKELWQEWKDKRRSK